MVLTSESVCLWMCEVLVPNGKMASGLSTNQLQEGDISSLTPSFL